MKVRYFKILDFFFFFGGVVCLLFSFFPLGDKTFKHRAPCVGDNPKCPSVTYF